MRDRRYVRAPAGEPYRQQIISLVRDRRDFSQREHDFFFRRTPTLYNLYRGMTSGRKSRGRNDIHIPLIFAAIQSDVARKCEALLTSYPIISFLGFGPDDAPYARRQEALISAQFEDAKMFLKSYDIFLGADLYGVQPYQYGWDTRTSLRDIERDIELPLSGESERVTERIESIDFDGPQLEVVDILDFYPHPGPRDIDDMQWVIRRRWVDLPWVEAMAAAGRFDKAEVARLKRESSEAESTTNNYKEMRFNYFSFQSTDDVRRIEPFGKPIELLEMHGIIPEELTTDGLINRVITIANNRYLMRNRPQPNPSGLKPFGAFTPTPDLHHFYAPGKAEVAAKMQVIANRFTNQQLDALDMFIDPAFVYNEQIGGDPNRMRMKPGAFIPFNGPIEGNFLPITPDLRGVEMGTMKTNELSRWIQQATGILEDVVQGLPSGRDETARGFLGRQEAGQGRLIMEGRMGEKQFLEPVANEFASMNRRWLSLPRAMLILGQSESVDPVTGGETVLQRHTLTHEDVDPVYAARGRGAFSRLGRGMRQQNKMLLLQAAASNPVVAGAVNWLNFFRDIFREFEFDNVNELIASTEEFERVRDNAMGAAPTPGLPGAPSEVAETGDLPADLTQGVMV